MATSGAPTTLEDLKALLEHDNKVKLAGVDGTSCMRRRESRACLRLISSPTSTQSMESSAGNT
jgi:hypothetical protein